ncbi:MAG: hypothetical protein GIW95_06630 [Candidatus Eremiobacteraeota bacterium]|nr:hypothetical protein [Candidatus Eremiobacteraeota bacterium]
MERTVTEDATPSAPGLLRPRVSISAAAALALLGATAVAATTYGAAPAGFLPAFLPVVSGVAIATQLMSA